MNEVDVRVPSLPRRGGLLGWQARRLKAHVEATLPSRIYVKDLAALLNLSVSHFSRLFKRTFGTSAQVWICRRRIELAKALMLTTEAPLSAIAQSCGMTDQSHLTNAFRRVVGETPHAWRKSRRVKGRTRDSGQNARIE
jgi:AraC family transcriptional regulator